MTQAVFFDLDETLIRHSTPVMEQLQSVCHQHLADLSLARWELFQQHLLSHVGQLWKNIAAYQGQCEAMFVEIFRDGLELTGSDMTLARPMVDAFIASVVNSTGPTEGAHEVLDRLADAGIVTGIITNGFGFLQKRKAEAHGLTQRVRFVLPSEDAGVHKPDARIFQLALQRAGATAAKSWHVGDNHEKDIAGATAAGLRAMWYDPDGTLAKHAPPDLAPHLVIRELLEIPALVRR